MKRLWVAAALAPLSFAAAAHAQVTISNGITSIATDTANNGQPSDVIIGAGGSVKPTTAGTASAQTVAVTMNSSNNVTNNGTISAQGLNYTTGILAQVAAGGYTATIDNTGPISISETNSLPTNSTNGIATGPFAIGTNRFGIDVEGGPLTGTLIATTAVPGIAVGDLIALTNNGGTITITGENSAGIQIGAGGLVGDLQDSGTITVTGDNSFGIHALGPINGNVAITVGITATGQNTVGVALDQGATGTVDISSAITVTGFHSLTPPSSTNQIKSLVSSQLLPGGPAVTIGGSVGDGISVDAPIAAVTATSTVAAVVGTTGGTITAEGSTALEIGSTAAGAGPITIGAGPSGSSLLIGGTVLSTGLYQNFNAEGIQIGSNNGAAVSLPGGINITGSVSASTVSTSLTAQDGAGDPISGTAIGLHLMPGAAVGAGGINIGEASVIGGVLSASSASSLITGPGNTVTALQIDPGAGSGVTLTNYGTISASITGITAVLNGPPAAGGLVGTATAISDKSGAITAINNYGAIVATITPVVPTQTVASTASAIAIDKSQNTGNVIITQSQAPLIPATSSTSATAPTPPSITGDVLFGSGAATLNLQAGTLTGAVSFGASAGNVLDIEGGAVMTGALSEATGGQLALTVSGGGLGGTLNMTQANAVALSSLTIGKAGVVDFTVDPSQSKTGVFNVAGSANLAAGAQIGINLISTSTQTQTFTLITTTGTLTSGTTDQSLLGPSTYLANETINATTGAAGTVSVTVSPKTAAQLGLNPAEAAAYPAILSQLSQNNANGNTYLDAGVTADVLSKLDRADFIHIYDQFLPDFEGGPFDSLVVGQQQIAQAEADAPIKLQTDDTRGWVQEIGFLDDRQDTTSANGYRAGGFGVIGGLEEARGDSAVGLSASFLTDGIRNDREAPGGLVSSEALQVGAYWRDGTGGEGLNMHASINGGYVYLSSDRLLFDENNAGVVNLFREAKSQWNGATAAAEFGASYQIPIGRFYIRPEVIADYILLYESAFVEHGGGVSMDLGVDSRTSEEASVLGDLVIGADMGGANHWRPELTLGWRQIVSGGAGDTTAHFLNDGGKPGASFTLSPQVQDRGSLLARIGIRAGGNFADFSADAGGELSQNYQVYNARAVARFLF